MPVIALIILAIALFFAKYVEKFSNKKNVLAFFIVVCLLCEVFCFNYETFRSMGYDSINGFTVTASQNIEVTDHGYVFHDEGDFLEINNIVGEVENIYIKTNSVKHTVRFFATDDANANRYHAGDRTISKYSDDSSYIKTNFTGKAKQIRIYIPDIENRIIMLSDIGLNLEKPFSFNLLRPVLCLSVLCFIYFLIVKRDLWNNAFDPENSSQNTFTVIVAIGMAALFLAIPFINPGFVSPSWAHHNQYNELAQAFLQGQLHLDKEVPEELLEMENPYDRYERRAVFRKAGKSEPWDTAFYDGKYYVYFGVLPVLLFYLPANILGIEFPNFLAVVMFSWVFIAGIFLLYRQLIKTHFKNISYTLYITLSLTTILSSGILYIIKRPDFYSIPIIGALAFTVMGLYFWLSSIEKEVICTKKMMIGSIFMASVIALRPNLVFFSCSAFIIFWHSVFSHRELLSLNSKVSDEKFRGLKNTLYFCMPYVIIAGLVMIYNYLRFDSCFDFGASYNLTTSDMTQRGFALDRFGLGVFEYLFAPPPITATFPFLSSSYPDTSYIGFTSREGMFGGIFATCPVLWIMFAMHKTKDQKPFKLVVFLIITSFITCLLDIQAGGILPRYTSDFAPFFVIAAVIILFMLYHKFPDLSTKFAAWGLMFTIIFDGLLIIAGGSSTLQTMNRSVYMYLQSTFSFFL